MTLIDPLVRSARAQTVWTATLVVVAVIAAGIAFGTGWIIWKDLQVTQGQLDEMESARVQDREKTKLELRAYISVRPGGIFNVDDKSPAVGYVWIENTGQTPAKIVKRDM